MISSVTDRELAVSCSWVG